MLSRHHLNYLMISSECCLNPLNHWLYRFLEDQLQEDLLWGDLLLEDLLQEVKGSNKDGWQAKLSNCLETKPMKYKCHKKTTKSGWFLMNLDKLNIIGESIFKSKSKFLLCLQHLSCQNYLELMFSIKELHLIQPSYHNQLSFGLSLLKFDMYY